MTRLLAIAVGSVLALTGGVAVAADTIRVGLIAPLSGGSADFGNSMRLGAELAARDINEAGGVLGRPIELVVRDDRALPEAGRVAAQDLVERERVLFTLGFCNTGVAMRAAEVFQSARHVLMVPCSQGTAVTRTRAAADNYIFRVAPSDAMNARFLVHETVTRRRLTRIAILADTTPYGDGGVKDLSSELARFGLAPVHVGRFDLGVASLSAALGAARSAGADALVVYAVGPEQAAAVSARAALKWPVPYFAPWPLSFRSVLERVGPAALEGTLMAQTIVQDTASERRSTFIPRYLRHSKEDRIGSLMAAAQAYDALHLMVWALFQTRGDASGPALKAALENLERPLRGVVTTYARPFSADDHEAFVPEMIWLGEWRGGEIVFHHADDRRLSAQVRRKPGAAADPVRP